MTLLYIVLATLAVSLISFVGVLALVVSRKSLDSILLILVALAGGGLMGGAFLHLIPEAVHALEQEGADIALVFLFVILGFLLFLLIEQYLHWHHHHCPKGQTCGHNEHRHDAKPMSRLILFGDGVHNLIDGLVIAAAFVVNPGVGLVTTLAVALHEIPQEIGDFGVLVYGGYKKGKALLFNFFSGLTAVLGGVLGFYFAESAEKTVLYLLPIAAGGFIYIAASDLVPEIKHGEKGGRVVLHFAVFVLGIALMLLMKYLPLAEH